MADLPRASPDECLAPELLIPDGKPDKQSQEQLSLNFQNKFQIGRKNLNLTNILLEYEKNYVF